MTLDLGQLRTELRGASPGSDPDTSTTALLEEQKHRLVRGGALLEEPERVESMWGDDHHSIWPRGEPTIIAGGDGVGKTTLGQQVTLKVCGIGDPVLLGFPVTPTGRVLYLACDRPAQAIRSLRRMLAPPDLALLNERLAIWKGPLPFDVAKEPGALLQMARWANSDVVVIDSLKDIATDLSKEETGQGVNRAFQLCCSNAVEVLALHHQRKAQQGTGKPRYLADVYGSRFITAGAGSVVMLYGDAGDPIIEFSHLKQPTEPVGPLQLVHDHVSGTTTVLESFDAYTILARSPRGATAAEAAQLMYGGTDRNSVQKARNRLERLVKEGKAHPEKGARGGSGGREYTRYYLVARDDGPENGA